MPNIKIEMPKKLKILMLEDGSFKNIERFVLTFVIYILFRI